MEFVVEFIKICVLLWGGIMLFFSLIILGLILSGKFRTDIALPLESGSDTLD